MRQVKECWIFKYNMPFFWHDLGLEAWKIKYQKNKNTKNKQKKCLKKKKNSWLKLFSTRSFTLASNYRCWKVTKS